MKKKRILIIDDDHSMRLALSESLESCGYETEASEDGYEALNLFRKKRFDLVLTDMRMPKMTGIDVLKSVKNMSPDIPVILLTAYGTVGTAVEAMKEGAAEFIMKPFSLDDLETIVKNVLVSSKSETSQKQEPSQTTPGIITKDPKFISILDTLRNVARSKSSILIQGESGTGKELVSKFIHQHSNRRNNPFVAINCAAIPHNLLESEMFGYEKGAFTGATQKKLGKFELADTGTLLLDEVSEMDIHLQAKLLRVIQESEIDRLGGNAPIPIDVRIIATSNVNLATAIEHKTFRGDLYYRLNVIPVKIPPLRERNGDILFLTDYFLEKFSREKGAPRPVLSETASTLLKSYPFPGNVRELENIIERAVVIAREDVISVDDLPFGMSIEEPGGGRKTEDGALRKSVEDLERRLIVEAMEKTNDRQSRAAALLGVSERMLRYKLKKYGLKAGQ